MNNILRKNSVVNAVNKPDLENSVKLCLSNAKQYIKDSEILYSFKSCGHALALTLISDIELGKATIYHLLSKSIIAEDILPSPYGAHLREKRYNLLVSESWWIGLVITSNVDELVQGLLDSTENAEIAKRKVPELVKKMAEENKKLDEFEELWRKCLFVDLSKKEGRISTPLLVEEDIVKTRLHEAKQRIENSEPFLALTLNEVTQKIAKHMIEKAFQSIMPLRTRVSRFTLSEKTRQKLDF